MRFIFRHFIFAAFFVFVICPHAFGISKSRLDSLKVKLAKPANDSERVVVLNAEAHKFLTEKGDFEKAIERSRKAYALSYKIHYLPGESRSLLNMGNYYLLTNNIKKAKSCYNKGLKIAEKIHEKILISDCSNSLGEAYRIEGSYDLALGFYLVSTRIDEEENDVRRLSEDFHNIGHMYKQLDNSKKALFFLKRSINFCLSTANSYTYAENLLLIGDIKLEANDIDSALWYFKQVLDIRTKTGYKPGICVSYMRLGTVALKRKEYEKAIAHYQTALDNAIACNEQFMTAASLSNLADAYFFKRDYKTSLNYAQQSLKMFLDLGMKNDTREIYLLFSKIYTQTGEPEKALKYLDLYIELNKKITKAEKSMRVAEMQTKYETERKEHENEILTQKYKIQNLSITQSRYLIIGLCALAFLIAGIAFLLVRQSRKNAIHAKKEMEQKLLRSQMNPHFIFNAMVGIQNYIYKEEPEIAANYLSSVVQLMRLIIDNSKMEYVPLEKEILTLHHYLTLQQVRFPGKFDFAINTDPEIDTQTTMIPPMMAQPAIENAIVHGLMNKTGAPGKITVNIKLNKQLLLLEIEDDGIGREKAGEIARKESTHLSIATNITEERLKILNRKAKNKNRMFITDLVENGVSGTRVTFEFSLT